MLTSHDMLNNFYLPRKHLACSGQWRPDGFMVGPVCLNSFSKVIPISH